MKSSLFDADLPDDPRLLEAVQGYLDELERGGQPRKQEYLARYPDLAGPLERCLEGLEFVHQAAAREPAPPPRAPEPALAEPLGDFQIVREIGRGGMGIVYEAVQRSLGRRVALKVLPFAATFDARHLQRFRNEAQAAAQLHHTNIVPVHAVGCERGVHFYAMQLIEGQSLAAVLRALRRQAGHPTEDEGVVAAGTSTTFPVRTAPPVPVRSAVDTQGYSHTLSAAHSANRSAFHRRAAELIAQAADALEHAHQAGIVHRDVKPANLIVEPQGRLWVTDFGLAQFHTGTALTQTGDLLGTLRYMSPEQAGGRRGPVDARTDVYALGATLYELVTLQPLFPGQTRPELIRQILDEEPRAPRSVDRTLPVELETIILKAVAKNVDDRYSSAEEFAADLRRFLEDRPIRAKRPGLGDRIRKWARRHPSVVVTTVVVLAMCVAGLLVNNRMIAEAQARTDAALHREKQRADEASRRFRQARQAVDLLVQVSQEELSDDPPTQAARKRLLEMALTYYQEFLAQSQGDADAQAELAAAQERVRGILDELATLHGAFRLGLVSDPTVQDDLDLTEEQRQRVAQLRETGGGLKPPWSRLQADDIRRKIVEAIRAREKELETILRPEQVRRLRQIDLQVQGPKVFLDADTSNALALTPTQRQHVREIERDGMRPEFGKGGPDGDKLRSFEEAKRATVARILATLTPEQRQRWAELTGRPFEGRIAFPPRGPGGFGPK